MRSILILVAAWGLVPLESELVKSGMSFSPDIWKLPSIRHSAGLISKDNTPLFEFYRPSSSTLLPGTFPSVNRVDAFLSIVYEDMIQRRKVIGSLEGRRTSDNWMDLLPMSDFSKLSGTFVDLLRDMIHEWCPYAKLENGPREGSNDSGAFPLCFILGWSSLGIADDSSMRNLIRRLVDLYTSGDVVFVFEGMNAPCRSWAELFGYPDDMCNTLAQLFRAESYMSRIASEVIQIENILQGTTSSLLQTSNASVSKDHIGNGLFWQLERITNTILSFEINHKSNNPFACDVHHWRLSIPLLIQIILISSYSEMVHDEQLSESWHQRHMVLPHLMELRMFANPSWIKGDLENVTNVNILFPLGKLPLGAPIFPTNGDELTIENTVMKWFWTQEI